MLIPQAIKSNQGFGLIEVLVSMFILAVGLLGVASMQVSSIKMNQGAYHRSQANILMTEILDRIRLNKNAYLEGNYDDFNTDITAPGNQDCIIQDSGCSKEKLALQDIREFNGFFNDINGLGDNFVPFIPGGSASLERDEDTDLATVTVTWKQDSWDLVSINGDDVMTKDTQTQKLSITVRI